MQCQRECNFLEFHTRCDFFRVPLSVCFVWVYQRAAQHDRNSHSAAVVTLSFPLLYDDLAESEMSYTSLAR